MPSKPMRKVEFASCECAFELSESNSVSMDMDFNKLDMNCPSAWSLICAGNTKGCFQLESRLGRSMSKRLKPSNIEELAALISIMRPGCISGDTKISINRYIHKDGNARFQKAKIRDIVNNPQKFPQILSYDETSGKFISNKVINAFYSGDKECFKVIIQSNERRKSDDGKKDYKLECTADHKLLTLTGWKQLKDIKIGERILVNNRKGRKIGLGTKSFRQRCYNTYQHKCIFCDWSKGSLDVNHITGNRFTNNNPNNLCYMCPNHHREFTEGGISVRKANKYRLKYKLPKTIDGKWCKVVDKISVGIKDVYDISMTSPHNNFIAGGVIVHNCLEAIRDNKSVSNHFIDKKNGQEEIDYFHSSLEPILRNTYGEMVYQEQAMEICQTIAGFDLAEADMLRKAIGKKKPEEMSKLKLLFMKKTEETGILTPQQAEEIFGWIQKSQRYSFNKSHAVSYALNAYLSAYAKAHFPNKFFASYLKFAKDKIDPLQEIQELVNNANIMGVTINSPKLATMNKEFALETDGSITFGLTNIKGVGDSVYSKLIELTKDTNLNNLSYIDSLFLLDKINSIAAKAMICVGAITRIEFGRQKMLFDYNIIQKLTEKEKKIAQTIPHKSLEALLQYLVSQKIIARRRDIIQSFLLSIKNPPYSLEDSYEWIADIERCHLGAAITCQKIDGCDLELANCDCKDLFTDVHPKNIVLGAEISDISVIRTKKGANPGQEMAFIKIIDGSGGADLVAFPEEYLQYKDLLILDNTIMFKIEPSKQKDAFIIKKCWQI